MNYLFEWDNEKAKKNLTKHNVRFDIATSIFCDQVAITIFDDEHSDIEDRWITIGLAQNSQLLVVIHTYKLCDNDAVIRIISARKATKKETKVYRGEL